MQSSRSSSLRTIVAASMLGALAALPAMGAQAEIAPRRNRPREAMTGAQARRQVRRSIARATGPHATVGDGRNAAEELKISLAIAKRQRKGARYAEAVRRGAMQALATSRVAS